MRHSLSLFLMLLPLSHVSVGYSADDYIWIEGEAATSKTVQPHSWYSDAIKKEQLSEGGWISNFTDKADGVASYVINVPADGDYALWVRANVIGAMLSYRINDDKPIEIDTAKAADVINIANDGKPDLRIIGWVNGGSFPLKAGKTSITFTMHSVNNHHGGIDCFVLTRIPFTPNGILKPGQKLGTADAGWWAFEPDADPFARDALLDLRHLNEKVAGESGFVRAVGDEFQLGNGQPIRFWAINTGHKICNADDDTLEMTAARWAKMGINMVRIHGGMFDRKGNDPTVIDRDHLEKFHHVVQVLKRHGIYIHVSHFFPLWMQLKASDGITGAAIGKHPFTLPYFEPRMQQIYRDWVKQILTTKINGKALIDEPAVACVEIINEDSLFFWTFNAANIGDGPLLTLETQYAEWLKQKYGRLDKAFTAWGKEHHERDNATANRAALLDAWNMTRDGMKGDDKRKRMTDQIAFLATTQRNFYRDTAAYMRELGCKSPISASNWTTADNLVLGGVERWTYLATDVVDKHGYFSGKHEGEAAGYSVREGHTYEDACALTDPESVPISYLQIAGKPHIDSEIAWNKPNRFVADGNLLVASYAALQGVDGYIWFAAEDGNWLNNGNGKWTWMMPGEIGQSPAAALQYRRGDVKMSEPVVRQISSDADVLALNGTGIVEGKNSDFRMTGTPASSDANQLSSFDPLTYFAGRVERSFDKNAKPVVQDLRKFIDRKSKRITSVTGELTWNYGDGLLIVNTPNSQAVTGFLSKAGQITFSDLTITSAMEYGTVHVISLDGQPISTSHKILIQAFSEEKMYGFRSENGVIKDAGRAPINVRDIEGTVAFKNASGLKAIVLNSNGYAASESSSVQDGLLKMPRDAMYVIVIR
jgi:hypothetical protein